MNTASRINLLRDLIMEIDYNLYKSMFLKSCIEDPQENKEKMDNLLRIIDSYDTQANQN